MKRLMISAILLTSSILCAFSSDFGNKDKEGNSLLRNYQYYARLGYNLGGTAPIGMPATIRTLHSYTLQPNFSLGVDAYHSLYKGWGFIVGLHFDNKGMKTDAGVKGYHMKIVRGGEQLEGIFTGSVVTKVDQSQITIPLQGTYDISSKVRIKLGPYISYATSKKFEGWAYDGYLRRQEEGHEKGDPTGQKVELGHNKGERGEYDFSADLRNFQCGIDLGADWYITKRWGACVGLTWGLTGVFKKEFTVIEQTLYPIYGNIGVIYHLK